MQSIRSLFPDYRDVLALAPEDLAGVLLELLPSVRQNAGFLIESFLEHAYSVHGDGYPSQTRDDVALAVAEAISWLMGAGLAMRNPMQPARWYVLTRRGKDLKSRPDLEAFRKGRTLPADLMQPVLAKKVHPLFMRGDHDVAVFQAFKEVEVAVRKAARYPDELVGQALMQKAFNSESGPLRNEGLVSSERQAEMFLFAGAMGHAKNPASHRDVNLTGEEAAKLIVLASYLLELVGRRALSE